MTESKHLILHNPYNTFIMSGKPKTTAESFWNRVDKTSCDCWNWTGFKIPNGYGMLRYRGKKWVAHRLAYSFAYGGIPDKMNVLHLCDNRACCNPDHLWLGTQRDNMQDAQRKGRISHASRNQGESCASAKLKEGDVKMIREEYSTRQITQKELATKFGVGQDTISLIVNNKRWGWLS